MAGRQPTVGLLPRKVDLLLGTVTLDLVIQAAEERGEWFCAKARGAGALPVGRVCAGAGADGAIRRGRLAAGAVE